MALWTIFLSWAGAILVATLPAKERGLIRGIALGAAVAGLAAAVWTWMNYDVTAGGLQEVVTRRWIPLWGLQFKIGVDGLSLPLLVLTGVVAVCGVLFSWETEKRTNEFFAYFLILIGSVYGVFLSLDLFLLFVFYELTIIPKYLLIVGWGSGRKDYAAMKLALYSVTSGAVILLGLILLHVGSGLNTMDWETLRQSAAFSETFQRRVFPVLFVGFAVLAGMVPFHTWAPTGHVAAPTAASMLLAGVVMKMGAYGCLRVAIGLLPLGAEYWSPVIAWLGAGGIVYGAVIALVQTDFKFVIGYSSVSHMGFVVLGLGTLTTAGLTGAVFQMVSHGLLAGLLFAVAGSLVYERAHTRELAQMDRFVERMPGVAGVFVVAGLAAMGLPGFSGFVAEFQVLLGTWQRPGWGGVAVLAAGGVVLSFTYTLVTIQQAFFQKIQTPYQGASRFPGLTWAEKTACGILLAGTIYLGLFPAALTNLIQSGVRDLARVGG